MERELHPFAEFTPEERQKLLEDGWAEGGASGALRSFSDTMTNEEANSVVADFVRERIREKVDDPELAENLLPVDHPLGSKRLCLDTNYFEAYNRDNVDLVNLRKDPIEAITPKGIKAGGTEYEVDAIIFALGFDAVTGALRAIDIYDTEGVTLRERWEDGPETYLGLSVVGFPNFFALTGPGSPAVLGNAIVAIEIQVEWVAATIEHLRDAHLARIEPTAEAARGWTNHAAEVAEQTLFIKAKSWFLGSNIPGKPRVFLPYAGGMARYRETLESVAQKGYDGFVLRDENGRTSSDTDSVSVGSN
jgi:cyclohexanone monooxygenase